MNMSFRKIVAEKGQGLIEFVLILAFVAVLAMMMFGGDLKGTLSATITETNRLLSGLFSERTDWGKADTGTFQSKRTVSA